jgi:hypothetical protein
MIARMTMPIVLTREMTPNGRLHWRKKAKLTAQVRGEAKLATQSWLNTPGSGLSAFCGDTTSPVTLDVEIEWPKGRKTLDDDNAKASLKTIIDGMSDALWFGQDKHVTLGTVKQTRGAGGLRITLRTGKDAA